MVWLKLYQLMSAAFLVVVFMILVTVIGSFDKEDENVGEEKLNNVAIPSAPTFSQDDFSDLATSFEPFRPKKKSEQAKREKTAEELAAEIAAAKQKIDKTLRPNFEAFDDEHQIGLVGIFKQESTFAVLQVINYETKSIEYKKLQETEILKGYKLVSVQDNSVKLNNGQRELNLILFKRLNG